MKRIAKSFVVAILGWQVRRLQKISKFKTIAVVGGIGKTSTKFAISQLLGESLRVRYQEGNYNDIVSVPLVFFGSAMPSLINPLAWLKVFMSNHRQIRKGYPYDVVVLELGTDGPGQIVAFSKYLKLDITVLTAIVPEHMVYFDGLDQVASEELSVAGFSNQMVINTDLCPGKYIGKLPKYISYSKNSPADYRLSDVKFNDKNVEFSIKKSNDDWLKLDHSSYSDAQLYSIESAAVVADLLGVETEKIKSGIGSIGSVPGRMQKLVGVKESVIIDDTYNASPEAMKAAIETVYRIDAQKKIMLLGNMNELGSYSPDAHTNIGNLCNPDSVDLVFTLGVDANRYLAEAAENNGCKVVRCLSPYEAGEKILEEIEPKTLVFAKGSQNGVFAEEAVKLLLANPDDSTSLVRQSKYWQKVKNNQFKSKDIK